MEYDKRPWGEYWVLEDSSHFKVKKIMVQPGHRLSFQYHNFRSEVWTIVEGIAEVILNDVKRSYGVGDVISIPQGVKHRIGNESNLPITFIEVQYGSYFGEDDIVRITDDYDRS